jgi:hypothetical protein
MSRSAKPFFHLLASPVAQLAQVPAKPLGDVDPARINATLDVIKGVFKLATPVTPPTSTRRDS